MSAEPSICITIPFHSNVGYLDEALRSLVAQSDPDWTAIVVDDAGPLPAAATVDALADPRLRCLRNPVNLGVAGNFNRCLEVGGEVADVVVVLHADDVLEPGFVATIRRAHRRFLEAAIVATRVTVIDSAGDPVRTLGDSAKRRMWPRHLPFTLRGDRGLARLVSGQFLYCPAASYRVDKLPALRFDSRWQQVMDLDLFARVLLADEAVVLVPDRVYRYRRHADSMSARNTRSGKRHCEEVAVIKEIVAAARQRRWRRTVLAGSLRVTVRVNAALARLDVTRSRT
jgi:glycosyltransferase involved in cell wall biosynthesis